jgi:hypothetical protein
VAVIGYGPYDALFAKRGIDPIGKTVRIGTVEYTVLGVARHSETLEEFVVYRQEYGDHGLWVRPAAMFAETVVVDGDAVPRFRLTE